jgi:hypothetical protein
MRKEHTLLRTDTTLTTRLTAELVLELWPTGPIIPTIKHFEAVKIATETRKNLLNGVRLLYFGKKKNSSWLSRQNETHIPTTVKFVQNSLQRLEKDGVGTMLFKDINTNHQLLTNADGQTPQLTISDNTHQVLELWPTGPCTSNPNPWKFTTLPSVEEEDGVKELTKIWNAIKGEVKVYVTREVK